MNIYKHIKAHHLRIAWQIYKWTGVDPHKILAVWNRLQWHRPFDQLSLSGVGVELGVYRGIHALDMLRRHPKIRQLYLCDGYLPYGGDTLGEQRLLSEAQLSAHRLLRRYDPANARHQFVYLNAPKCVAYLPNQLDFVYIDANHSYVDVWRDIETLWPLVKSGGVFGGHDFQNGFPGVIKAVTEFATGRHLHLFIDQPDWWVIKP